jgi:hypothetical protein
MTRPFILFLLVITTSEIQLPFAQSAARHPKPKGAYYSFKADEVCSKVMGEPIKQPI